MRAPKSVETPEYKAMQSVFKEIMQIKGFSFFTPGYQEMSQRIQKAYKHGMTTEETIAAMK